MPSATISMALSAARRRNPDQFFPGPDRFASAGLRHFHHGAIDRGEDAAGSPSLLALEIRKETSASLIGGFCRFADRGIPRRFCVEQSLQYFGADLVAAEAQRLHGLFGALEVGLCPCQIGFAGERGLDGQLQFALRDEALLG